VRESTTPMPESMIFGEESANIHLVSGTHIGFRRMYLSKALIVSALSNILAF
jgi:hypothetical protein